MSYNTTKDLFTGICDAIRSKTGSTEQINHQDIPDKIKSIVTDSNSDSTSNNCEAYLIDVTNPVVNFSTTSGTIKAYGYAKGTTSGYTTPSYGFTGTQYSKVASYGSDTTTEMTLSVDDSGNLTGLPSDLASGTIIVIRGI